MKSGVRSSKNARMTSVRSRSCIYICGTAGHERTPLPLVVRVRADLVVLERACPGLRISALVLARARLCKCRYIYVLPGVQYVGLCHSVRVRL